MENIYYSPEAFNLTIIAEIDFADSYDFDKVVVWKNESGERFWADDSGCSCPSPFESYVGIDSLNRLTADNWNYFEETVRGRSNYRDADVDRFLNECR